MLARRFEHAVSGRKSSWVEAASSKTERRRPMRPAGEGNPRSWPAPVHVCCSWYRNLYPIVGPAGQAGDRQQGSGRGTRDASARLGHAGLLREPGRLLYGCQVAGRNRQGGGRGADPDARPSARGAGLNWRPVAPWLRTGGPRRRPFITLRPCRRFHARRMRPGGSPCPDFVDRRGLLRSGAS